MVQKFLVAGLHVCIVANIVLVTVCSETPPEIASGMFGSGDTPPYFINEIITYQCNGNYDADGADLTNECIQNTGNSVVPAVWSRMPADLTSLCRAGNK